MKVNYQLHMVAGNLTADVKATDKYAAFTVALDVGYGEKKTSHFFNMTAFPNTFPEKVWGVLTNLKKGGNIAVEYEEQDGSYEKNGVKVRDVKRIVKSFKVFFNDKPKTEEGEEAATTTAPKTTSKPAPKEEDDDVLF